MGETEDLIRCAIEEKYGSIPKMAKATGMPVNTIYHALERGLENTRTETSKKIKSYLFDWDAPRQTYLTDSERELLECWRLADDEGKQTILSVAQAMRKDLS